MKVKILDRIEGQLNGIPWPAVGSVVEVHDEVAQTLIRCGLAESIAKPKADESEDDKPSGGRKK